MRDVDSFVVPRSGYAPAMTTGSMSDPNEMREHASVEVHTIGFREFAPSLECVREVRQFVGETLESVGASEDCIFECQLVADELAANAVRHAGSIFSVAIELTATFVRLAVRDDSDAPPRQRANAPDAQSGRGLVIVSGTSGGWGTVPLGRGKEIWADVTRRPHTRPRQTRPA
jgi:anti-sigma regulatory factor (Ser/Thr protein kinase)